jgi:hypothetical protein
VILTPMERDRLITHRALLRYLKACGFKPYAFSEDGEAQPFVVRYANKQKTLVEFNEQSGCYTLQVRDDPQKYKTQSAHSIITRVEALLGEVTQ